MQEFQYLVFEINSIRLVFSFSRRWLLPVTRHKSPSTARPALLCGALSGATWSFISDPSKLIEQGRLAEEEEDLGMFSQQPWANLSQISNLRTQPILRMRHIHCTHRLAFNWNARWNHMEQQLVLFRSEKLSMSMHLPLFWMYSMQVISMVCLVEGMMVQEVSGGHLSRLWCQPVVLEQQPLYIHTRFRQQQQ